MKAPFIRPLFISLFSMFSLYGQADLSKEERAKLAQELTHKEAEIISVKNLEDAPKVLYVTHEPGTWHDYTGQRKIFEEIAKAEEWHTDVLTAGYEGLLKKLSETPDFADGYDVVVYNICVADTKNLMAAYNILQQTKEKGINSILIHGAMHSFWASYSNKIAMKNKSKGEMAKVGISDGVAEQSTVTEWESENAGKEFPVWGDFCGHASIKHIFKSPIDVTKKKKKHPAVSEVPDSYVTGNSELYMTYYKTDSLQEILLGTVSKQKKKFNAPILWENSFGKGKVMGLSLGHFTAEWSEPHFQSIIKNSIEYLAK